MGHKYYIAVLLAVHVTTVNIADLCNEIVDTVRDFLSRSVIQAVSENVSTERFRIAQIDAALFKNPHGRDYGFFFQVSTHTHAKRNIGYLLSTFTTVTPNIPRLLGVQTMLLSQGANLLGQETLVLTIVPLGKSLSFANLLSILELLLIFFRESNLEGLHSALARTDVDMGKMSRVDQFARANDLLS